MSSPIGEYNIQPFPFVMEPLTQITPFSYRDGMTYAKMVEGLRRYVNYFIVPEFNAKMDAIIAEFQEGITNAEQTVITTKAEWQTLFDAFMANVTAEMVAINDPVVADLMEDETSATGIRLRLEIAKQAVSRNEAYVSVKDSLALGNGVADDGPAMQLAATLAGALGVPLLIPGGQFRTLNTIVLAPGVGNTRRKVIVDGDVVVGANVPAFSASGSFGLSKAMAADLSPRGRTLTVDNNAWFVAGETIFLTSNDTVPGAPDKLGALRKVISNTGATTVNIDVPYYRTMLVASSLRAYKTTMHPGVSITGGGNIRSENLDNNEHLIEITLANDSVVDLNIGPSGGPGVLVAHCDGFIGGGHIHDLRDQDTPDGNGLVHFGYGWNVSGGTRRVYIGGTAYKCRHAFTTNTAPVADGNFGGEPENIITEIVTSRCSNKAIDTHRAGWDIMHIVKDSGSYGALQVRADNVSATVISSETYDAAINVSSLVTVPPKLERIEISGSGGALRTGVLLLGPAIIGDILCRGVLIGVDIQTSGVRINSVDVYGSGSATGAGIKILGNNNTIGDVILENVGTGIVEDAGSTGNIFHGVRRFTNVGTVMALQAYNHMMSLRIGEYIANTAALGTVKGRYPVYDNAGNQYGVVAVYTS